VEPAGQQAGAGGHRRRLGAHDQRDYGTPGLDAQRGAEAQPQLSEVGAAPRLLRPVKRRVLSHLALRKSPVQRNTEGERARSGPPHDRQHGHDGHATLHAAANDLQGAENQSAEQPVQRPVNDG